MSPSSNQLRSAINFKVDSDSRQLTQDQVTSSFLHPRGYGRPFEHRLLQHGGHCLGSLKQRSQEETLQFTLRILCAFSRMKKEVISEHLKHREQAG